LQHTAARISYRARVGDKHRELVVESSVEGYKDINHLEKLDANVDDKVPHSKASICVEGNPVGDLQNEVEADHAVDDRPRLH